MTKTTLYGENLQGLAKAAQAGRDYQRVNGTPRPQPVIGFRIDGAYYSVKFNKAGISVWEAGHEAR